MKLVSYCVFRVCRNCFFNGSWTTFSASRCGNGSLESPLKLFKSNLVKSFVICHSLLKRNVECNIDAKNIESNKTENDNENIKKNATKGTKDSRVSVIYDNKEMVMHKMDAEKFAKLKKMKLEPVEGSKKEKMKYKLVQEIQKNKGIHKDSKKIIIRAEISPHDLETKIKHMLKQVNKGDMILCTVDGQNRKEKLAEVVSNLEQSKLKEYLKSKKSTRVGFQLIFEPISTKTDETHEKDKTNKKNKTESNVKEPEVVSSE